MNIGGKIVKFLIQCPMLLFNNAVVWLPSKAMNIPRRCGREIDRQVVQYYFNHNQDKFRLRRIHKETINHNDVSLSLTPKFHKFHTVTILNTT
jgi:hypothetical protein